MALLHAVEALLNARVRAVLRKQPSRERKNKRTWRAGPWRCGLSSCSCSTDHRHWLSWYTCGAQSKNAQKRGASTSNDGGELTRPQNARVGRNCSTTSRRFRHDEASSPFHHPSRSPLLLHAIVSAPTMHWKTRNRGIVATATDATTPGKHRVAALPPGVQYKYG